MTDQAKPSPVRPLPSWVPPGWYPDPLGQGEARYWDGKRWSLEYRDDPPPQPVPASPSEVPASPPPTAAPITQAGSTPSPKGFPSALDRWKEIPMAARVIVGVIVLLIIIGVASSGGKKTPSSATTIKPAIAATPTSATAPPPVALRLATGDYSVTAPHTTLRGTVSAGATVAVAEDRASVHGTHWSKAVPLRIGSNVEEVTADLAGHQTATQTITVTRHHSQAELEAKQRAREEAQRTREREAAERVERYKANAVTIPYNQLNKNPEEYVGKVVKYHGQVFQIQEEGGEGVMLLSVTEITEGFWEDNVWINYDFHVNAAKEAIVTVYGEITGQKSYKTQIGGETYVPEMKAKYIEE